MKELVIIPVYNELQSIWRVLEQVRRNTAAHVLLVDDGSDDGSSELIERATRTMRGVTAIRHPRNLGYGAALIDGFRWADAERYDYAITMDCDEQHEPSLIARFFEEARHWDVVSGSRYLEPVVYEAPPPPDRLAINATVTRWINRITGYTLTDAFCGFKAYRVTGLKELELDEPGYAFPLQFWIQASKCGLRVKELPVPLIYKHNFERRFGGQLDDAAERLRYYRRCIIRELKRIREDGR